MPLKTNYLYVITHCQTCYNQKGIFTGRIDSVLTKEGHKHAKELAQKLKNVPIDVAYISPLLRTKQTLEHFIKDHPDIKVIADERIIERDYGELSRKSKAKYQHQHPDLYPIFHRSYDVPPPGGESIKQVEKRVLSFIKDVLNLIKTNQVNVLIVCHGNSIRPIRRYFEKLSVKEMMQLEHLRHQVFKYQIKN